MAINGFKHLKLMLSHDRLTRSWRPRPEMSGRCTGPLPPGREYGHNPWQMLLVLAKEDLP
jgi:hypothetical protein